MKKVNTQFILSIIFFAVLFLSIPFPISAKVAGICSNCHTMHNSQNGDVDTAGPRQSLLVSDCLGCHSGDSPTGFAPVTDAPLVLNIDTTVELAGGNFKYIKVDDVDAGGHNIKDLNNEDDILDSPPGVLGNVHNTITDEFLTCAGTKGCHGRRISGAGTNLRAMQGAHHNDDDDGVIDNPDPTIDATGYRFLRNVKGYENNGTYKYQNFDATNHNEYFGATTPPTFGCGSGLTSCHSTAGGGTAGAMAASNTISGFCATCHGIFHTLNTTFDSEPVIGIGDDTTAPFMRHPTDIMLKGTGEYSAYNPNGGGDYSVDVPVARGVVPTSMSATVVPGTSDETGAIVMCLSCHKSHASEYSDMLRWDYDFMEVGSTAHAGEGCFTCHTKKDGS